MKSQFQHNPELNSALRSMYDRTIEAAAFRAFPNTYQRDIFLSNLALSVDLSHKEDLIIGAICVSIIGPATKLQLNAATPLTRTDLLPFVQELLGCP